MSERESQQHEWTFFRQHSSGNTTDAYDYCSRCGAIRARYFWKDNDGQSHHADPQYFGAGIEDHTTNQPLCAKPSSGRVTILLNRDEAKAWRDCFREAHAELTVALEQPPAPTEEQGR